MTDPRGPSVLIVGGFATSPPNYWPLRRRLLAREVERVDIAPLWTPDWALAGMLGFGSILRRTGRAIARTYVAGGRRPILVVGHSAGGIATRLAMSDTPFHGRVAGVSKAVGCLVTLGTPHGLVALPNRYQHAGHEAAAFLDRTNPGAWFGPRTRYLSVGARNERAHFSGLPGRIVDQLFTLMLGEEQAKVVGDGIVPLAAAHLDGARQMTFDGVRHGHIGGPWYGDDPIINRWWPEALELWHQALDARAGAAGSEPRPPVESTLEGPALAESGSRP